MLATDSPYAVKVNIGSILRRIHTPLLHHLDIELTERCNNACIHCYINLPVGDQQALHHEMSTAQVKRVLEEAVALGVLTVRLSGGEPLLRPDFPEIYLFARKLGLRVRLFTNGRLITPELADLFARVPPLEKIEITSYGMHKESYEAVVATRDSFEEFRRGIQLLLDRHIPFLLKGAVLPPNAHELDEFEEWAKTIPSMTENPTYAVSFQLRGRRDSLSRNKLIERLRLSPEKLLPILGRDRDAYLEEMCSFCSQFLGPPGDELFICGAGSRTANVDAYGKLQPCMLLRHPDTTYDLKSGSMKDAVTHFFLRLKSIRATNPEYLAHCARCFLKALCDQCPAKSWMETGTLDTPVEYLCEITHAQAIDLGLVQPREKAWEVNDWKERVSKFAHTNISIQSKSGKGEKTL